MNTELSKSGHLRRLNGNFVNDMITTKLNQFKFIEKYDTNYNGN